MPAVKVVVVDDHDMLRVGVRDFLTSMPEYALVGEAATAREGLRLIEAQKPDVVLMDIMMPGMDGIVATREVRRRVPGARIVVLSAHEQLQDVVDALDAGAVGYVLKADPPELLVQALATAVRGSSFVSPAMAARLATLKGCRLPLTS